MSKHPVETTAENVIQLFSPEEAQAHELVTEDHSSAALLDSLLANPRFSTPANDEPHLSQKDGLAPTNDECRKAMLLNMWIEVLVDDELISL